MGCDFQQFYGQRGREEKRRSISSWWRAAQARPGPPGCDWARWIRVVARHHYHCHRALNSESFTRRHFRAYGSFHLMKGLCYVRQGLLPYNWGRGDLAPMLKSRILIEYRKRPQFESCREVSYECLRRPVLSPDHRSSTIRICGREHMPIRTRSPSQQSWRWRDSKNRA